MAIAPWNDSVELLHTALRYIREDFLGLRIAELGNQRVKGWSGMVSSKAVFGVVGAHHVSLDINGRDGALAVDLGEPLDEALAAKLGVFDVVTNFGTSEHVASSPDAQRHCFETVHRLCRPGGAMIHYVPAVGCSRHGVYEYSIQFFEDVQASNNYTRVVLEERPKWNRRRTRKDGKEDRYVCAVFVKEVEWQFNAEKFPKLETARHARKRRR